MSESELLDAFRKERSEEAFAELVRRYSSLVYSVAKRRLANEALAQDITQLVFIRFAQAPPKLKTHAELAAWLHRTTIHVAIDTWRSETRRRAREQQAVVMEPSTSEHTIWEELSPNLDEALNQLSDQDRQALLLRFFGRKTMRDVGAALRVSEDAAKMRVSRALDRLRKQMAVGGTACTATALGTLLLEYSIEAVPRELIARLSSMRLPAVASMVGTTGLLDSLLRVSGFKLAAAAVVLALIGGSAVQFLRVRSDRASEVRPPATTRASSKQVMRPVRKQFSPAEFSPAGLITSVANTTQAVNTVFHVLDAESGIGLAYAKLHAAYFGAGGEGEHHDLLTDLNGDVAIPMPDDPTKRRAGNFFVTVEGYVPKVVNFAGGLVPAEYSMTLDRATTVGGIVVDEQGLPVPGVEIKVQGPGNQLGRMENVDFQTCPVISLHDGSWSCRYIPKDYTNELRFILRKPDFAATFPVVPVDKVDLTNLVLVINRGFVVTGQVTNPQNRPIVGARVRTTDGIPSKRQSTDTDESGTFRLSGVPGDADTYQQPALETNESVGVIIRGLVGQGQMQVELAIEANGFAPQVTTVDLLGETNFVHATLSSGHIFRGRVVDETGYPIPGAVVQTDWDNQGLRRFEWGTRTDAAGRFEWDSAPETSTLFWFEADGYHWQRGVLLLADGSDHEITLERKSEN
jgi:RNA polymerase sigma factor (sigma-70 family)